LTTVDSIARPAFHIDDVFVEKIEHGDELRENENLKSGKEGEPKARGSNTNEEKK
jgi:hypothetical protein